MNFSSLIPHSSSVVSFTLTVKRGSKGKVKDFPDDWEFRFPRRPMQKWRLVTKQQIWIIGLYIMRSWPTNYIALFLFVDLSLVRTFLQENRPCSTAYTGVLRVLVGPCSANIGFACFTVICNLHTEQHRTRLQCVGMLSHVLQSVSVSIIFVLISATQKREMKIQI